MNKEWNGKWGPHYKKKARFMKLFWGLLLVLMGIFLVISKMGLVTGISVWSVFFTIIFAALLVYGLIKRNFIFIFFSIAFLCIIYDDQLGITALTPWTVLLAALLLSIGMEILFHKKKKFFVKYFVNDEEKSHSQWSESESYTCGEKVCESNNFSARSKYINPETFEKGMFTNSFGSMNIFFENVPTEKKESYVHVENAFGEINIYVPSSWAVDMNIEDSFGSRSNVEGRPNGSGTYLLHVSGDNSFGEIHVIYQ